MHTPPSLDAQVFIQMYRHHPQFHVLLEGMDTDTADAAGGPGLPGGSGGSPEMARASSLLASSLLAGTFTTAALNALSISEDALPPPEQLLAMMAESGEGFWGGGSKNSGRDCLTCIACLGSGVLEQAAGCQPNGRRRAL